MWRPCAYVPKPHVPRSRVAPWYPNAHVPMSMCPSPMCPMCPGHVGPHVPMPHVPHVPRSCGAPCAHAPCAPCAKVMWSQAGQSQDTPTISAAVTLSKTDTCLRTYQHISPGLLSHTFCAGPAVVTTFAQGISPAGFSTSPK
jgi:hypothetical protein